MWWSSTKGTTISATGFPKARFSIQRTTCSPTLPNGCLTRKWSSWHRSRASLDVTWPKSTEPCLKRWDKRLNSTALRSSTFGTSCTCLMARSTKLISLQTGCTSTKKATVFGLMPCAALHRGWRRESDRAYRRLIRLARTSLYEPPTGISFSMPSIVMFAYFMLSMA